MKPLIVFIGLCVVFSARSQAGTVNALGGAVMQSTANSRNLRSSTDDEKQLTVVTKEQSLKFKEQFKKQIDEIEPAYDAIIAEHQTKSKAIGKKLKEELDKIKCDNPVSRNELINTLFNEMEKELDSLKNETTKKLYDFQSHLAKQMPLLDNDQVYAKYGKEAYDTYRTGAATAKNIFMVHNADDPVDKNHKRYKQKMIESRESALNNGNGGIMGFLSNLFSGKKSH